METRDKIDLLPHQSIRLDETLDRISKYIRDGEGVIIEPPRVKYSDFVTIEPIEPITWNLDIDTATVIKEEVRPIELMRPVGIGLGLAAERSIMLASTGAMISKSITEHVKMPHIPFPKYDHRSTFTGLGEMTIDEDTKPSWTKTIVNIPDVNTEHKSFLTGDTDGDTIVSRHKSSKRKITRVRNRKKNKQSKKSRRKNR